MSTSITSIATEGQKAQYQRFVEDIAKSAGKLVPDKVELDKDGLQRLIEHADEYKTAILEVAVAKARELSLTNQFASEEVQSKLTYPKEYKGPKPIIDQIKAIASIFGLDPASALEYAKHLPQLPNGAEGWFAVPNVAALAAKHFPEVSDLAEQYCRAIQLVHEKIAASRRFYNYREGEITTDKLRVHARTAHALDLVAEMQGNGDILIIAAQLGMRHRGRSVRRAREVFVANEYGLGSLAVGSIILTHPERLVRWEELDMDCPGDEFASDEDGRFVESPLFRFCGGEVRFDMNGFDFAYDCYASASGLLPQ